MTAPSPSDLPRATPPHPDRGGPGPGSQPIDPRVADAVSRLDELDGLALADQVEVFSDVHRRLAAVLSDPDSQA